MRKPHAALEKQKIICVNQAQMKIMLAITANPHQKLVIFLSYKKVGSFPPVMPNPYHECRAFLRSGFEPDAIGYQTSASETESNRHALLVGGGRKD